MWIYSNTSSNIVWKTTILVTHIYTVVRRQRRYTRRSGKKLQILNWLRNKYINNVSYSHVLVAQGIARWTSNPEVAGSNPAEDAQYFYHSFFINVHMTSMKAKPPLLLSQRNYHTMRKRVDKQTTIFSSCSHSLSLHIDVYVYGLQMISMASW